MTEYIHLRRKTALLYFLVAVLLCVCVGLLSSVLTYRARENSHAATASTSRDKGSTRETNNTSNGTSSSGGSDPSEESDLPPWAKSIRIPRETYAHHYALFLHPDLDTGLFSGTVGIDISVTGNLDYLLVHSKHLTISETTLTDANSRNVGIKEAFEYEPNEFWVMRTEAPLSPGNYTIHLSFNGSLTDGIVGMYRSVYTNKLSGKKRFIATSKFQPTFARRAFPCFDEPSFKATFHTRLVRPSGDQYIALSNTPVELQTPDSPGENLTTVQFVKSVPMVTYLACFIVCDFAFKEEFTQHGVKFRVYAAPDRIEATEYAVKLGSNITDYFEQYFNVSYPLPKQDMIAIPDFVSGAMEHWGLITYRETNILYDPASSSSYNQQRVATVISHELVHQWFGNLVTLEWWNDLWLNEGFASYIEYKGVAQYHPDWDMMDQFLPSDLQRVMNLDSTLSSHPIVQTVQTPDEITAIFDSISYSKGASVLRMLEAFMKPDRFRAGISSFLKKFSYRNAVTQDLWNELEVVSDESLPITSIMDTWTRQMGYPVLYASRNPHNSSLLQVAQRRFLVDPQNDPNQPPSQYGYRWEVPVTVFTSEDTTVRQVWLHQDQESVSVPISMSARWYKLNYKQQGYYRVNYNINNWRALSRTLNQNYQALSPADRSSLINDAFSLATAGHVSYDVPLDMTSYLRKESHYVPWLTAMGELKKLLNLLYYTETYASFRNYVVQLVAPHFDTLGWDDEGTHLERRGRINLVSMACRVGYRPCLQGARDRLQQLLDNPDTTRLAPNLRSSIYSYGMREINAAAAWDRMWTMYLNETNSQERNKLAVGLASVREPWLLQRYVQLAKNESHVRSQDYFSTLSNIAANPVGNAIVWNFFRTEWQSYLVPRFSLNERYLGFLVPRITRYFSTARQLREITAFFEQHPEAGAGARSRQEALENTRANINWLRTHRQAVHSWIQKHGGSISA